MKIGKKVAIGLIAVSTILMINTKVQAAQVEINTDTLRLREEASTESKILGLLSIGEKYEVTAEEGEWYQIQYKDKKGYVKKEFVKTVSDEKGEEPGTPTEEPTTPEEPQEQEPEPQTPEVTGQTAQQKIVKDTKLKSLPLFGSVTIETLAKGDQVMLITRKNNWAYVQTETQSGWVLTSALEAISQEDGNNDLIDEPNNDNENQDDIKTGYISSTNVNFRKSDSTSSEVIRKLAINTEVKILSQTEKWCKVEINGTTGYVAKDYVADKKTEITSRSLEEERTGKEVQENAPEIEEKQEIAEDTKISQSSETGEKVVDLAKTFLGNKYIYAAEGPKNFDCSGFTLYLYKQYGVSLPHSAASQINYGTKVERSQLKAGDAVFFQDEAKTKVGHVGIYMGDGNFIHSSSAVGKVTITPLSKNYYDTRFVGARRYI